MIQHDFNIPVRLRHQLHHQFPAGAAWRADFSVRHDGEHLADFLLPVRQHIENGVPLGMPNEEQVSTQTPV